MYVCTRVSRNGTGAPAWATPHAPGSGRAVAGLGGGPREAPATSVSCSRPLSAPSQMEEPVRRAGFCSPRRPLAAPSPPGQARDPHIGTPSAPRAPATSPSPAGGLPKPWGFPGAPSPLCLLVLHPHIVMAPAHSDTLPLSRAVSPSVSPHDSSQVAPPPSPGLNPGLGRLRACTGDRPPLHGSFSAVSLQRGHSRSPQVRRQPPLTASLWGHPCPPGPGSHSGLSKAQLSSVCPACGFQQRGLAARSPREAGRGSHSARQTLLKGTTITVE